MRKPNGYWKNKENCLQSALQFTSKTKWIKSAYAAYESALVNGWLDECCAHMISVYLPSGYWKNISMCKTSALKYSSKREWANSSDGSAYNAAKKYGWLEECCAHMVPTEKPKGHWKDKENCLNEAKKYSSKSEWRLNSYGSYQAAYAYGYIGDCSEHMDNRNSPNTVTLDKCIESAKKYATRKEWSRGAEGYFHLKAAKEGWLDECCGHMIEIRKPKGYWNDKDRCIASAKKYNCRSLWQRGNAIAYFTSKNNGWFDECVAHMEKPVTDADAIYIWKAEGQYFNGNPVYKIGVSSFRLGDQRIVQVKKSSGFVAEMVAFTKVIESAYKVETLLHSIGDDPKFYGFDGCTEFRALSDNQLKQVLEIINEHAASELEDAA